MGFILHDSPTPLSGLKSCPHSLSPLHAELEALAWAMESALQRGFLHIRMETDCSEILRLLDDIDEWLPFASEIDDIVSLRSKFIDYSINCISQLNNV